MVCVCLCVCGGGSVKMKSGGVFHGNKSGPLKNLSCNDATSCSNVSRFTTNIKGMFTLSGYALKICSVLQ